MSSDSQPSGQQQIIQNNDPWSGQQTYLTDVFSRAKDLSNQPMSYYPNSTVVPFSNQTESALQGIENRATSGSPVLQAGQQAIQDTASGNYLSAGNPYFQDMLSASMRPVTENFTENVLPGIQATFSSSGRYGSGAQQKAVESATDALTRNLADVAGGLGYQNYGAERDRMTQAAQLSPTLASADYTDLGQLQNVGQAREAMAGAQLQEDINRYNFNQNEARQRLGDYAALVAGGSYGGSSSTTQPIYSNPTANALGLLSSGAGIAGGLFGQGGIWPGALG